MVSEVVGYCVVYADRVPFCTQTGELWLWVVLGLMLLSFAGGVGFVLGVGYEAWRVRVPTAARGA